MEESRTKRRLIAIISLGVVLCAIGMGVRVFHRKPIHGVWLGLSYHDLNGKMVPDEGFGQFLIKLNADGTYLENGNGTSGSWSRVGDRITLTPTHFQDLTPEEHRVKYRRSDGSKSETMERLLEMNMKPMVVNYNARTDRLTYSEPTLYYEYERG